IDADDVGRAPPQPRRENVPTVRQDSFGESSSSGRAPSTTAPMRAFPASTSHIAFSAGTRRYTRVDDPTCVRTAHPPEPGPTFMIDSSRTVVPEDTGSDPYGWLACPDEYQLPEELTPRV